MPIFRCELTVLENQTSFHSAEIYLSAYSQTDRGLRVGHECASLSEFNSLCDRLISELEGLKAEAVKWSESKVREFEEEEKLARFNKMVSNNPRLKELTDKYQFTPSFTVRGFKEKATMQQSGYILHLADKSPLHKQIYDEIMEMFKLCIWHQISVWRLRKDEAGFLIKELSFDHPELSNDEYEK